MRISRKQALEGIAAGIAAGWAFPAKASPKINTTLKGNINHSVCRWCYRDIPLETLCESARAMGLQSVELLEPDEWQVAIKYGLTCAMPFGSGLRITQGFNDPQYHERLKHDFSEAIPKIADLGFKNVICFSGNRNGLDDNTGLENCARGLDPVMKVAQKHGITVCMELLNSKVNHPDYQCDHTVWGVSLVDKVGSEHFKLLYDIYHMQIMEGDVIATIRKYKDYLAHYHTGGVPGRHEIDETQELYYPAIMKAIVESGFKGFVAQEFIPAGSDPLKSLRDGVTRCDV